MNLSFVIGHLSFARCPESSIINHQSSIINSPFSLVICRISLRVMLSKKIQLSLTSPFTYSFSAMIGSTLLARRAGIRLAAIAVAASSTLIDTSVAGSLGPTP